MWKTVNYVEIVDCFCTVFQLSFVMAGIDAFDFERKSINNSYKCILGDFVFFSLLKIRQMVRNRFTLYTDISHRCNFVNLITLVHF